MCEKSFGDPFRLEAGTGADEMLRQPGTLPFTKLASGWYMIKLSTEDPKVLLVGMVGHRPGDDQIEAADEVCKAM